MISLYREDRQDDDKIWGAAGLILKCSVKEWCEGSGWIKSALDILRWTLRTKFQACTLHCGRKVGSTVLDQHAAVASLRRCHWRSLFQFPWRSSVAWFGLGVRESGETGFIYGLQRLIISEIFGVVWSHEGEKQIAKDVAEDGRALIWGTIPVFSCTDWSKLRRHSGCVPAGNGIGHLTNTSG